MSCTELSPTAGLLGDLRMCDSTNCPRLLGDDIGLPSLQFESSDVNYLFDPILPHPLNQSDSDIKLACDVFKVKVVSKVLLEDVS